MFKILGLLVGLYALNAIFKGEVYTRHGLWGRTVSRAEEPRYFWTIVTIYFGLALAMATLF